MWSHNCFSRGAPWDNPSKYFANDKNCSRTALVIWTLDDWGKKKLKREINVYREIDRYRFFVNIPNFLISNDT